MGCTRGTEKGEIDGEEEATNDNPRDGCCILASGVFDFDVVATKDETFCTFHARQCSPGEP